MTSFLTVENLSKRFGGLQAVADVSLSVTPGEICSVIGPNGAGKTTLFNCITGYYPPSSGSIEFDGHRMNGLSPDRVCRLGMVRTWQKVRPLTRLSVLDNVVVGALCRVRHPRDARETAYEQLRLVGLESKADRPAGGLSVGERKKLEVARALATRPRLLLLDEVMGGLNPSEREQLIELILTIRERGITQIVIEHDMRAIMRISDRIVVLNSGSILAAGAPAEIIENPQVIEAYLGAGA